MMKRFWKTTNGSNGVVRWTAVAATVAMTVSVSAQQPQQPPQQPPQTVAPTGQNAPQGTIPPVDKYIVGTAKPPVVPGQDTIDLTLEQAIQIALDKNLDLQVAKMNPQIQDYVLQSARASFLPQIVGSYNYSNSSTPSTNTTEGVSTLTSNTNQYNTSVSQSVPWYGGNYSVSFNNTRQASNNATATRNPTFNSSLQFRYTQPLLANFRIDNTRNTIRTQQVQRQITDIQLLQTIENTKASVRAAYWALRQAIESIEINQRAQTLAQELLDNDKVSVQIGVMAEIDTAQPDSAVASAQVNVLNAQVQWQQADLTLKRLLVSGDDDPLYKKTINPSDLLIVGAEPNVDIDGAVQVALTNRTDLQQALKSLEISQLNLELTQNGVLPQLNLQGGFTAAGLGGPTTRSGVVTSGGYGDAFTSVLAFDQPTWTIGATFTYPLGMVVQRASLARAQLALDQQKANLKVTQLTIATDVTTAGLSVRNSYLQYVAARKATEAQQKLTEAEQTRFSVGLSNNFLVVQQQNSLTADRLTELQRLIAYINALADFDRKQRIGGGGGGGAATTTGGSGS